MRWTRLPDQGRLILEPFGGEGFGHGLGRHQSAWDTDAYLDEVPACFRIRRRAAP